MEENYPSDVPTSGWDTVFAIDIEEVNRALTALPASPTYSVDAGTQVGSATLTWSFHNWRITDTPGGNMLEVTLDFAPGSSLAMAGGTTALDGWSCAVTFQAHFGAVDPVTQRLKANTASDPEWVSSVAVRLPAGLDPNDLFPVTATIQTVLKDWFNTAPEAVELFEQEFATVDIGADLAASHLYYLQPLVLGFAGALMADGITKALGILAMTREIPPPSHEGAPTEEERKAAEKELQAAKARAETASLQLSPNAIVPGATAAYIVSARVFLEHMLKPACASTYGADVGSFEIYGAGTPQLRNRKPLSFQQELDGIKQPAKIAAEQLNFFFEGAKLRHTVTSMNIRAAWNASVDVTLREAYALRLAPKPGTEDETIFLLDNVDEIPPDIKVAVDPGYILAAEIIAGLLTLAGTALAVITFRGPLAQKMSEQAAKYVARIIAGLVATAGAVLAVTPVIIDAALRGNPNKLPNFGDALNVGLGRIRWPGAQKTRFVPTEGHFANAMVVTIDPRRDA